MNQQLKVLFLAADSAEKLRTDREYSRLMDAVRKGRGARALQVEPELAVRPGELQQAIERHRPEVVHFSGHGQAGMGIRMADGELVRTSVLVSMFASFHYVQLVVLNACKTYNTAQELVKVVDYAVGMNGRIEDEASIAFVEAFYDALGSGGTVEEAFARGKVQIPTLNLPGTRLPKLCVRTGVLPHPLVQPESERSEERRAPPPGFSTQIIAKGRAQINGIGVQNGDGTTMNLGDRS
jgi:hypothetical protein